MTPTRPTRRRIALTALVLLGALPALAVLATGLYLHSPLYRASVEAELTEFFGLPTRVGRVIPRSWDERLLFDVEIFLPDAGGNPRPDGRIAHARRAQWLRSGGGLYDLEIHGGSLDLSPARWARGDFSQLEQSLRHDYRELGLRQVLIKDGHLRWSRGKFAVELDGAEGEVHFVGDPRRPDGVARLFARQLNGHPAPVVVDAEFDPLTEAVAGLGQGNGLIRRFELRTLNDPIAIAWFNLGPALGRPVTAGTFSGRLTYSARDGDARDVFTIHDSELSGVRIGQLLPHVDGAPIDGLLHLAVREVRIEEGWLKRMRFRGDLLGLDLPGALRATGLDAELAEAGLPLFAGRLELHVGNADLRDGPIASLTANGKLTDIELAQVSEVWREQLGPGKMRGRAEVQLDDLEIANGKLTKLSARLKGLPGGENTVDGDLVRALIARIGLNIPPQVMADRIAYRDLDVRVTDSPEPGKLQVHGRNGRGTPMLTLHKPLPRAVSFISKEVSVNVPAPAEPVDAGRMDDYLARPLPPQRVIRIGEELRDRFAATQPAE